MAGSDLGKRVAVAAVGIPLVVAAVYVGGWVLGGLLALASAGAAWELYRMSGQLGIRPFAVAGCLLAAGFPLTATAVPDTVPADVSLPSARLLANVECRIVPATERSSTMAPPLSALATLSAKVESEIATVVAGPRKIAPAPRARLATKATPETVAATACT